MSGNNKMDGENGDGEILPINAKMSLDVPQTMERKEYLPRPKWLSEDYKSNIADLEGWQCVQIARVDGSRKDKYYKHMDYGYTFRSKKEVQHFLDTGEVKGKGRLQKKLTDDRAARWEETLEGYLQRQKPRRRSIRSTSYTATTHPQGTAHVDSDNDNDSDGDGGSGTAAVTSGDTTDDDVDRENLRREDE